MLLFLNQFAFIIKLNKVHVNLPNTIKFLYVAQNVFSNTLKPWNLSDCSSIEILCLG